MELVGSNNGTKSESNNIENIVNDLEKRVIVLEEKAKELDNLENNVKKLEQELLESKDKISKLEKELNAPDKKNSTDNNASAREQVDDNKEDDSTSDVNDTDINKQGEDNKEGDIDIPKNQTGDGIAKLDVEDNNSEEVEDRNNIDAPKTELREKNELIKQQKETAELNKKIEESEQKEIYNTNIENLNKNITNLNDKISDLNNEISNLNKNINKRDDKIYNLNEDINKRNEEISKLNEDIKKRKEEISKLNKDITTRDQRINELEIIANQNFDNYNEVNERNKDLNDKLSSLFDEVDSLHTEFINFINYNRIKSAVELLHKNISNYYSSNNVLYSNANDIKQGADRFEGIIEDIINNSETNKSELIRKELISRLSSNSWINIVVRLNAYTKLEVIDIPQAIKNNIINLSNLITNLYKKFDIDIIVPEILKEDFNKEKFEYSNDETTWISHLCNVNPAEYRGKVYDIIRAGYGVYNNEGVYELQKPVVYYY